MSCLTIESENEQLVVTGDLTRDNISTQFEKRSYQLINRNSANINLSNVSSVDTAGLAWMLVVVEHANHGNNSIQFIDIPEELQKLAKLSAVAAFLPVQ